MSQMEKEAERRRVVEEAYTHPRPWVVSVTLDPAGSPPARRALVEAGGAAGFTVVVQGGIGHPYPRWRKASPDDAVLSFLTPPLRSTVRVVGHRPRTPGLIGFEVTWTDGTAPWCRVKYDGWPWMKVGVNDLKAELKGMSA